MAHFVPAPVKHYVIVWLVLVALATVSLFVSASSLGISLAIAAVKAGLVAAIFMHLASSRHVHRVVFVTAILFIVLLVLGIAADVGTREYASAYVP